MTRTNLQILLDADKYLQREMRQNVVWDQSGQLDWPLVGEYKKCGRALDSAINDCYRRS